jgi:hypothetical protein
MANAACGALVAARTVRSIDVEALAEINQAIPTMESHELPLADDHRESDPPQFWWPT